MTYDTAEVVMATAAELSLNELEAYLKPMVNNNVGLFTEYQGKGA